MSKKTKQEGVYMKRIYLKLIALAIAAATVLAFASCGNNDTPTEDSSESDTVTATVLQTENSSDTLPDASAATETDASTPASQANGEDPQAPGTQPSQDSPVNNDALALELYNNAANDIKSSKPSLHKKRDIKFMGLQKEIGWLADMVNPFIPEGENETYPAGTDYTSIFPVIGESWSSRLTLDDLSDVTCTDNGNTYTVVLKLKDETIPTSVTDYTQTIIGSAMAVNRTEEIRAGFGDAGELTVCDQDYYNCSITTEINKSTGKMVSCYHELNLKMYLGGKYGVINLDPEKIQPLLQITENYTDIVY